LARDRFLAGARQSGDLQVLVPALAVAALVDDAEGARGSAVALVRELERSTRDYAGWRAHELSAAVRVCAGAGELDLAERLLEGPAEIVARDRNQSLTAHAVLAEARGETEQAAALYGEAATRWTQFGHALERSLALLGRGRCLTATDRSDEAAGPLAEAEAAFALLAAPPLLEEAAALRRLAA
jgi:hypothetical protein